MQLNKVDFSATMMYLQAMYGKELSPSVLDIYWNALKEMTLEQFKTSVQFIVREFTPSSTVPFPVPATFFKHCSLDVDSLAHNAITAIKKAAENIGSYKSVDFGDGALHAVINRFGGWPTVARFGNDDQWKYQEKNFMVAYKSAVQFGDEDGPVLGLFAIENSQKTFSPLHQGIANKMSVPVVLSWVGYKKQIASQTGDQKLIDYADASAGC